MDGTSTMKREGTRRKRRNRPYGSELRRRTEKDEISE